MIRAAGLLFRHPEVLTGYPLPMSLRHREVVKPVRRLSTFKLRCVSVSAP